MTLQVNLTNSSMHSIFSWRWCYPTPSEEWWRGVTPRIPNFGPRSKVWTVFKQWDYQKVGPLGKLSLHFGPTATTLNSFVVEFSLSPRKRSGSINQPFKIYTVFFKRNSSTIKQLLLYFLHSLTWTGKQNM